MGLSYSGARLPPRVPIHYSFGPPHGRISNNLTTSVGILYAAANYFSLLSTARASFVLLIIGRRGRELNYLVLHNGANHSRYELVSDLAQRCQTSASRFPQLQDQNIAKAILDDNAALWIHVVSIKCERKSREDCTSSKKSCR